MFSIFFSVITRFYEILQYNFEDISPNLSYRTKAYKANKCLWTKQRRVGQSVWLDMWRTGCAEQQGNHSWPQQRVQSVEDSSKQIKREMWRRAAKSDGFQAWGAELNTEVEQWWWWMEWGCRSGGRGGQEMNFNCSIFTTFNLLKRASQFAVILKCWQ